MNICSKSSIVFLVQVDHLSGECVGQSIESLYQAGAANVQVMSTITKKNRPAYLYLIDCRLENEEKIETTIINELGTGGWHRIDTVHRYLKNKILKRKISVTNDTQDFDFILEGKEIETGKVRPEYDNVVKLKNVISEKLHQSIGFSELYNHVVSVLLDEQKMKIVIE